MSDVLTTGQAIERFGRAALRRHLRSGAWRQPTRGVVVTHNGALSTDEIELVALASSPSATALAGLTAARHWGFKGFEADRVTLVLPAGARKPPGDLEFHWSTRLGAEDVPPRTPRRTSLERSIIDAASWSPHPDRARILVISAFQQGRTSVRRMREALSRRGPCRHRALIKESILDAVGGIQSLPERDFDEIRAAAGLLAPTRQEPVKGPNGRYYLDVWLAQFNLAIEIHGIPHLAVEQWSDDLHRSNELVIGGRRVLAFSSYAVRHHRATVIDQLLRATAPSAA